MSQIKDLTGQRFGRITVIKVSNNRTSYNKIKWICKCECGKIVEVAGVCLKIGSTTSCGCSRSEVRKNIIGQKFGRLTVVDKLKERGSGNVVLWKCKCECGNEINVRTNNLKSGHTKSCGCLFIESSTDNMKNLQKDDIVENTSINQITRTKLRKSNSSGTTGVSWDQQSCKWDARIYFKNKIYRLGRYINKEDAIAIRKIAEKEMFGNFLDWYYSEYPEKKNTITTK